MLQPRRNKRILLTTYSPQPYQDKVVRFHCSHDRDEHEGKILSLSQGGLFVKTAVLPDKGSLIFVGFQFARRRIKCTAKVIYVNENGNGGRAQGFGVQFLRIMEDDSTHIGQMIEDYYSKHRLTVLPSAN